MNYDHKYLQVLLKTLISETAHFAALCICCAHTLNMGHAVAQLVETMRYKS
jgi:hypothetical protein